MIFTGQVWNMAFSYYTSLKEIPLALREAAAIQGWSSWQTVRFLEIPSAMIGLVWNSMMSMAGGWFFLSVAEAFTLRTRDFRLPGIGSYMNEATRQGDVKAVVAGIVVMILVLLVVDQVIWRPLVAWSERFKLEEAAETAPARSWVLELIERSWLYQSLGNWRRSRRTNWLATARRRPELSRWAIGLLWSGQWIALIALCGSVLCGLAALGYLLSGLPPFDAAHHDDWASVGLALGASFLRTTAAVLLGAAWTLPAGILIGRSPKWSQRLEPIIQIAASFPAPMLYPLIATLLAALHVPFTIGCVALMLLGSQWYILFNVVAGAMAIPSDLGEVAEAYHWSRWRRWTSLYVPAVFPHLVTGLVTAAGGAWNATIVSEYVQLRGTTLSAFGLGATISRATASGNYPLLCAAVLTMAGFVVLLNRLFWKRLYALAESRYSLEA
jgi:NitT/TauT family transport system permease protein